MNLNAADEEERIALALGTLSGHEAIVRLLLAAADVDLNCRDARGQTPLSLAAEARHYEIVKRLLSLGGVAVNARDNKGRTPLSWAVSLDPEREMSYRLRDIDRMRSNVW